MPSWTPPWRFSAKFLSIRTPQPTRFRSHHMGKIRYLALISDQPEHLARFYSGYFDMTELARSSEGDISLTDGYFNLTVFKRRLSLREFEPRTHIGLNHLGLQVDSIAEVKERYLAFNPKGIIVDE